MKSRARAMLRLDRILEALSDQDRRALAYEVYRTYGGPLTDAERASRYRDRRRHEVVTAGVTKTSRPAVTDRHEGSSSTESSSSDTKETTESETTTPRHENVTGSVTADFEAFWAAYPRKQAKGTAEKAWRTHRPPLPLVLTAIAAQKQSHDWLKDRGQFIPLPATWIRAKRWLDEVKPNGYSARAINDPWKGKTEAREVKL